MKMFTHRFGYKSFLAAAALIGTLGLPSTKLLADDESAKPQIIAAEQTFTHPSQLTITGKGFGTGKPSITLGGTPLLVLLFTETKVVVQLTNGVN